MEEWKFMLNFARNLLNEARRIKNNYPIEEKIIGERIIIHHLDHSIELLMKAFLMKKGYFIEQINMKKIKEGLTKDTKISTLLNKNKTIDYVDCLNIVSKKIKLDPNKKQKIIHFHRIRNEIQHRALDLPLKKDEEISIFFPIFQELYKKMFPDFSINFPIFDFY